MSSTIEQVDALQFINNMLEKLIKTELTTVGPLLLRVKQFFLGLAVPRFKQDLNNYLQVLVNSIKSVNEDAPKSDVDFFTKVVISMNPPLPDEIKHLFLGLITVTPPQTLQEFRDGAQEGDGVIITNALRQMFDRLLEAIQAANQMSFSVSDPLEPPGPDATALQMAKQYALNNPLSAPTPPQTQSEPPPPMPSSSAPPSFDDGKIYSTDDKITWTDGKIYKFNEYIGAAGYNPISNPTSWTLVTSGGYRKKSRKSKKSRKAKKTHRR